MYMCAKPQSENIKKTSSINQWHYCESVYN